MAFLTPPPRVLLHKARASSLATAAHAAVPRVRRFWRELWAAVQVALPTNWTLEHLTHVLRQAWQETALPLMPTVHEIVQALAQEVATAPIPLLTADVLGVTQAVQAIETSLAQVPATMATLPQALLADVAVLTMPQQASLVRMSNSLTAPVVAETAEAVALTTPTEAYRVQVLQQQARAQLTQRTRVLAAHLTWHAAQAGQQAGWETQAADGDIDAGRVRRFWIVSDPCRYCAEVPADNVAGVGLFAPFATPYGPALTPPIHPLCRCDVGLREI